MTEKIELESLADHASKLFTLPSIVFQLQELLYGQSSTADEIARLISLDPALTARILRLANSSFYSFPAQIDTVSRAVTIVGTNEIYNLALATAAVSTFRGVRSDIINMPNFWKHSVYSGLVAKNLLNQNGVRNSEYLFVAGLLHNIGLLVLVEQYPQKVNKIDRLSHDLASWEREKQVLGFTFADCSYQLLADWNLPLNIIRPVLHQHTPDSTEESYQMSSACVHIGDRAAHSIIYPSGFDYKNSINPRAWDLIQIDQENLKVAMEYAEENVMQILGILSPESIE
jgi:HD-like signal output (HDOD) protein